jgi:hypothetical protein
MAITKDYCRPVSVAHGSAPNADSERLIAMAFLPASAQTNLILVSRLAHLRFSRQLHLAVQDQLRHIRGHSTFSASGRRTTTGSVPGDIEHDMIEGDAESLPVAGDLWRDLFSLGSNASVNLRLNLDVFLDIPLRSVRSTRPWRETHCGRNLAGGAR